MDGACIAAETGETGGVVGKKAGTAMAPSSEASHDLYAILLCINQLERAWVKGHFTADPSAYHETLGALLGQYNALEATLASDAGDARDALGAVPGLELGLKRVRMGVQTQVGDRKRIAEATSAFITLLDAIKLGMNTRNDLHPLLTAAVVRAQDAVGEDAFKGKPQIVRWLVHVNKMVTTLSQEEMAQMLSDVESAYDEFIEGL